MNANGPVDSGALNINMIDICIMPMHTSLDGGGYQFTCNQHFYRTTYCPGCCCHKPKLWNRLDVAFETRVTWQKTYFRQHLVKFLVWLAATCLIKKWNYIPDILAIRRTGKQAGIRSYQSISWARSIGDRYWPQCRLSNDVHQCRRLPYCLA